MRSLLNFIYRFHFFLLFLLIEFFSVFLVIQYNDYQRATFLNSSNKLTGSILNSFYSVSHYINLRKENDELIKSFAKQLNLQKEAYQQNKISLGDIFDSVYIQKYEYLPAEVINNSANRQNNYLTLNIGSNQGVQPGMAVIAPEGVVGVVRDVSGHFSAVISLLNQNLKISAMLKSSGYYGSLYWDGINYKYVTLYDLPSHITVLPGDTIVTSGYSIMFPKGITVGVVHEINDRKGADFLSVKVRLAVDFKNVSHVMVVKNLLKEEQLELENRSTHD